MTLPSFSRKWAGAKALLVLALLFLRFVYCVSPGKRKLDMPLSPHQLGKSDDTSNYVIHLLSAVINNNNVSLTYQIQVWLPQFKP